MAEVAALPLPPSVLRWAGHGAWLTLLGALLSGPVALVVVNATHPEPRWQDARTFVHHFHAVQTLPFFLGFALVGGLVTLVTSLACLAPASLRPRASVATALAAAFAALVFLNYTIQTTFVPLLVRSFRDEDGPLLAALTMANPSSLGWSIEMWAYGVVGVATWLIAPVFQGGGAARGARLSFTANGPVSIGSALATAFIPGWALTPPGIACFLLWNALVVAMAVSALVAFHAERPEPLVAALQKGVPCDRQPSSPVC
jgi:hypothetical protein